MRHAIGKVTELRADALTGMLPAQAWTKLTAGDGAKRPRLYHWARAAIRPLEQADTLRRLGTRDQGRGYLLVRPVSLGATPRQP